MSELYNFNARSNLLVFFYMSIIPPFIRARISAKEEHEDTTPPYPFRFLSSLNRRAEKGMKQQESFGWTAAMVKDNSEEEAKASGTDMGLQAEIRFDGTEYQDAFDRTLDTLRSYASSGSGDMGWKGSVESEDTRESTHGRYSDVEVNGRVYQVIDETPANSLTPSVSICPVISTDGNETALTGGAYYLTGVTPTSVVPFRQLEICGARISIDEVLKDITQIVEIAKQSQPVVTVDSLNK